MSTEKHTHGLLHVGGLGEHPTIIYEVSGWAIANATVFHGRLPGGDEEAGANARRLVVCWNACEGVETDLIEAAGDGLLAKSLKQVGQKHEALRNAEAQRDELLTALENVIATHTTERKAELALSTATENYSDHSPDLDAYAEAAAASSKAEARAIAVIAKVKGGTA